MRTDTSVTSLTGRLAARAVALSLDAANASEDVVDHLLRLSHGEAALLRGAVRQVERRHHHPESAPAQLAIHALRMAALRAVEAPSSATDGLRGVLA